MVVVAVARLVVEPGWSGMQRLLARRGRPLSKISVQTGQHTAGSSRRTSSMAPSCRTQSSRWHSSGRRWASALQRLEHRQVEAPGDPVPRGMLSDVFAAGPCDEQKVLVGQIPVKTNKTGTCLRAKESWQAPQRWGFTLVSGAKACQQVLAQAVLLARRGTTHGSGCVSRDAPCG